jgi:uncharacterized membrane protein
MHVNAFGDDVVADEPVRSAVRWSPAQLFAALIGAGYTVLGAFALSHTGFDVNHVTTPTAYVWRWHHTPMLGMIELAFGVVMLLSALRPTLAKGMMSLLSIAALGFGIVALVNAFPHQIHHWLGVRRNNAWLYLGTGVIGLVASGVSPTFLGVRRERIRRRHVVA